MSDVIEMKGVPCHWPSPTLNKNDRRLYQRTPYSYIHWSDRVWKDIPCFRADWKPL